MGSDVGFVVGSDEGLVVGLTVGIVVGELVGAVGEVNSTSMIVSFVTMEIDISMQKMRTMHILIPSTIMTRE